MTEPLPSGWAHLFRTRLRRARAALRRRLGWFTRTHPALLATRQEAWAAHKAARRKRRKAETLLGRITGLPRSWRPYLTGWVVMHPAIETKAKRSPVRRKGDKKANQLGRQRRLAIADRVPRGRSSNPTALP